MKKKTSKRNSKKNSSFFNKNLLTNKNILRVGTVLFILVLCYGIYSIVSGPSVAEEEKVIIEVQDLSNYIILNYSTGANLALHETYKSGVISLPLNQTETTFNIISSKRAEYNNANNSLVMKMWVEAIFGEEYVNYQKAMIEEMNSFTKPEIVGATPLSNPKKVDYNNHSYYYSYKPYSVFSLLCSDCWFGSGKVFFPERNVSITVSFYKPIGNSHSQAISNMEVALKELIDKS